MDRKETAKAAYLGGKPVKEIAREMGLTEACIYQWLRKLGVKADGTQLTPKPCVTCGLILEKPKYWQRYCPPCSARASKGQRALYAQGGARTKKTQEERARLEARGHARNKETIHRMSWMVEMGEPDPVNLLRIKIPYTADLSKNRIWSFSSRGRGHVYIRKDRKRKMEALSLRIQTACQERPFFQGKVWLDILVQKPDHRSDAVNMVDTLCDVVKKGIGVDDRWFSIRRLDWQIVKNDPAIYLGISQEVEEDHFICSYCGIAQPFSQQSAHRRTCKGCRYITPSS